MQAIAVPEQDRAAGSGLCVGALRLRAAGRGGLRAGEGCGQGQAAGCGQAEGCGQGQAALLPVL